MMCQTPFCKTEALWSATAPNKSTALYCGDHADQLRGSLGLEAFTWRLITDPTPEQLLQRSFTRVRPDFVIRMAKELEANEAQKGPFSEWRPEDLDEIKDELDYHVWKLNGAVTAGNYDKLREYSADVANICMKMDEYADIFEKRCPKSE